MYDDARDMYELEYPAPDMGSKSGDRPTLVVALNGMRMRAWQWRLRLTTSFRHWIIDQ